MTEDLKILADQLRQFAERRDWPHLHTPRNLLLALVGEVGELAAEFQWASDDAVWELLDAEDSRRRIEAEFADVLIYLVRMADVCGVDLIRAANSKLERNEIRFPASRKP